MECGYFGPTRETVPHLLTIPRRRQQVASRSEMLGDGSIRRQKSLGMTGGFEPLHTILALACGPMRVLTSVIEITTLTVFDPGQYLPLGRAVALQLIGDNNAWHVLEPFEQLAKELLGGVLIAPALDQAIEDMVVLIDGSPEVMALTINCEKHLIQVPFVAWLRASVPQLVSVVLPKLQTPLPDGFMSDVDTALEHDLLHIAIAQGEAVVEPDAMANDFAWKAVIFVACGISRWRQVWLPIGVCEWFVRVHHRSEYLTGQTAGSTT
jgi:hypothetical protein